MHINSEGKSIGHVAVVPDRDTSTKSNPQKQPIDIFEKDPLGFSDYLYAGGASRSPSASSIYINVQPAVNFQGIWWDDLKHLIESLPVCDKRPSIDETTQQSLRDLATSAPHRSICL